MNDGERADGTLFGLIHSFGRLFRKEAVAASSSAQEQVSAGPSRLEADFAQAIAALKQRVDEQRRSAGSVTSPGQASLESSAQDRAAERQRRKESCHRAMREDIERMHAALRTGFAGSDLDETVAFLKELDALSRAGRGSQAPFPRARHAIVERLRMEAGPVAVARLIQALERNGLTWPDPRQHPPTTTPEELETSNRRRLTEIRASFLTYDLQRIAERMQGIVSGWGGDYPDPGSPLWQESVLKGVGAAIWGRLLEDFVEVLEKDREGLLNQVEQCMGQGLSTLHAALGSAGGSVEETADALARALRVLDEVVPEIAWELVRARISDLPDGAPPLAPEQIALQ